MIATIKCENISRFETTKVKREEEEEESPLVAMDGPPLQGVAALLAAAAAPFDQCKLVLIIKRRTASYSSLSPPFRVKNISCSETVKVKIERRVSHGCSSRNSSVNSSRTARPM